MSEGCTASESIAPEPESCEYHSQPAQISPRQMADLLELQRAVLESIANGSPFASILDKLCHLIEAIVPHSLASVMLYDTDAGELKIQAAPSFPEVALPYFDGLKPGSGMGSCGNAALCRKPVYISDVSHDPRWQELRAAADKFAIGSCWSIPIINNDELLGTFAITSQRQRQPNAFHMRILETASHLAGITLQNRQREGQLLQWAQVFKDATEGMVITDADGRILSVNHSFSRITGYSFDEVKGKGTNVLRSDRHDEAFYQAMWASLDRDGGWQGEIWNRRKNGEVYPEWLSISRISNQLGETFNYVAVFSDISSLKDSQRKLLHMAHHDPLTGLPNRLLMNARLEHILKQAKRNPTRLALMFIDLDHFKNVNDSFGHALGDQLLVNVAQRLRGHLREQDTIARIGGDEFVVILEQLNHSEDAARLAQGCIQALDKPFKIDDKDIFVTPSIGISIFPDDGTNPEMLLKNADIAMYRAKEQGRHQYAFYKPSMATRIIHRLSLETLLRRALEREEFEIHYQPQVSAADLRITGVEALLRWRHPEKGLTPPRQFIPILEETRLIEQVGAWALETACRQICSWQRQGMPSIRLAVNISASQVSPASIRQRLSAILRETAIDPALLELEITEHSLMLGAGQAIKLLSSLNDFGVSLAIDDFGTGYSSLSRLKQLPVHSLKIDRSLVRDIPTDPNDQAICRAVVALGHSLGLNVIAEGVEMEQQADFLRATGCDQLQGYLYGRPMPREEFEPLLAGQH